MLNARPNAEQPGTYHPRTAAAIRLACRRGEVTGSTAGLAPGYVQANLVVLPRQWAAEFLGFCALNPRPCPLIGMSEAGKTALPTLGSDIDIRSDLPRYCVWRDGRVETELFDISALWRPDLVAFLLGCSYSFEEALTDAGVPLRHVETGVRVPMYRTNIPCVPSGPFTGHMVVSMRPLEPRQAIRAIQITTRFPAVHGAPIHIGHPQMIGIKDVARPDYGDAVAITPDELPVFWPCGVTPQAVFEEIRLPFAITHAPGCMLVTDLRNQDLATL